MNPELVLDAVSISGFVAPVPLPATLSLFLGGIALASALGLRRRGRVVG